MTKRYSYFNANMVGQLKRENKKLKDENEQLRKENDMFSCELSVSANKEISRNCRIAELEEENKQLKQFKRKCMKLNEPH